MTTPARASDGDGRHVPDATFACPDLTTFPRPDELGLEAIGQRLEQTAADPQALAMTRMMLRGPALHTSHDQKRITWRTAVADALLPRLPEDLPTSTVVYRPPPSAAPPSPASPRPKQPGSTANGQHHLVDVAISAFHQLPRPSRKRNDNRHAQEVGPRIAS